MADGSIRISAEIDNSKVRSGLNETKRNMENSINTISNSLRKFSSLIATAFSLTKVYQFSKGCVDEVSKAQSALVGLQSIVEGQGRSFNKAKAFIDQYISDGLVPLSNATTAYKNLASRRYSDSQIQQTLIALKDSAAFARQGSLSYGDAIQGATEGLKNENSILVDNAGVTKNVSVMWKEYAQSIGTTVDKLTTQQKIQAEVNGILNETRFQTGDAAKYAATYAGQTARLSASFLNLKQNIGALLQGMFGQVIVWAGKAIDSINVFVQAIGKVIQMFTGKNPLNNITSGAIEDTSNNVADIGINADKASGKVKKLQKQLAGFDEINKLSKEESSSTKGTSGSGSSSGNVGNIGDLGFSSGLSQKASKEVDKLAKKIKSFLDTTMKTLKKYEPLLKGIGTGFLTAFGFKWIASALSKFSKLSLVSGIITAIKTALLSALIAFKLTSNPLTALAAGFASLWGSLVAFMGSLSPLQKVMVLVTSLVIEFTTVSTAVYNFTKGTASLKDTLLNVIPVIGAVGLALTALFTAITGSFSWIGIIVTGITALISAFAGLNKAQEELQETTANNIIYDETGVKIDTLTAQLVENNKEVTNTIGKINEWGETIDENNKEIEENISTIGYYADKVIYGGNITKEETQKMISAFQEVRSSVKENFELATRGILETFKTTLSGVAEDVGIDMKTISGHVFEFQNLFGKKTGELENNIKSLEDQMLRSGPTPELLEKYGELQQQYVDLNSEVPIATTRFKEQVAEFNRTDISLEAPEKAKAKIEELGYTFQELFEGLTDNKEQALNEFDNLIKRVPLVVSDPAKQEELIRAFEGYKETARKGFELKEEEIKTQFYTQVQRIQENFNQRLNEAAQKMSPTMWESLTVGMKEPSENWGKAMNEKMREKVASNNKPIQEELDKLIKQTTPKSVELGENIPVKLGDGIENKQSIPRDKANELVDRLEATAQDKELIKQYLMAGNNIDEGLAQGLYEKMGIPEEQARNLGNALITATRQELDSHSPSREFIKIGEDADKGLGIGIENKANFVLDKARDLVRRLENTFRDMNLSFSINFPDISWSANNLIYQFELMLNRIRDGLNTWLRKTTSSLNGLYIYGDGKVGYSSISRISIPRLAKGGITYKPTYAQIGEAGKEAVLPLQNHTEWMDTLADKITSKMNIGQNDSGDIVIYVTVDGEVIEKTVRKRQKKNEFATNGG